MTTVWCRALPLGAGALLLIAAPTPASAVRGLGSTARAADPAAPLLAVVSLAAWCLLGWLLVVALLGWASTASGRLGPAATVAARRLAPAAVRRIVQVALGISMTAAVVGTVPAAASDRGPAPSPAAVSAGLDWPAASAPTNLDWPTFAAPRDASSERVVVHPGDSLWAISARHLPPGATAAQIATAWPSWWRANRDAVGPDPDLIHPGQLLEPPHHP